MCDNAVDMANHTMYVPDMLLQDMTAAACSSAVRCSGATEMAELNLVAGHRAALFQKQFVLHYRTMHVPTSAHS